MPDTGAVARPPGLSASAECYAVYAEVTASVLKHPVELAVWHQTCVDAYAAQHVTSRTKPITVWFALNTLYLVLERGFTGLDGRAAHGYLATRFGSQDWPRVTPPASVGEVTVLDVALAADPAQQADAIRRWGASVWQAWSHVHDQVRRITDEQLAGWPLPR